jgi:hypothetical protein
MGVTEEENPEHSIVIFNGSSGPLLTPGLITMNSLHPTATELFDIFCGVLFGDQLGTGTHSTNCPQNVARTTHHVSFSPL